MGTSNAGVMFGSVLAHMNIEPCEYDPPARIINAYFANKVVAVDEEGNATVTFQPITTPIILGKIVYLVVETDGMQGQNLQVAVHSNEIRQPTAEQMLRANPNVVQQKDIAQNALQLMRFNAGAFAPGTVFDVQVGNFSALDNNQNEQVQYTNLETDYANSAIIKLRLCPNTRADFDRWARGINFLNGDILRILVQMNNDTSTVRTFNGLRVENRSFYEIYGETERSQINPFNFLPEQNGNRRKIGLVRNNSSDRIVYFYYDQYGQETQMWGEFIRETAMKRRRGLTEINDEPIPIPTRFERRVEILPRDTGSARWHYYVRNAGNAALEDIITTGSGSTPRRYNAYRLGIYVDLIRMPDDAQITIRDINFEYYITNLRKYCSPGLFAAFIGALGQANAGRIRTSGSGFSNATGFPSVGHINGVSIDVSYRSRQGGTVDDDIRLVGAFRDWGFTDILVGTARAHPDLISGNDLGHRRDSGGNHNAHFHAGNFFEDTAATIHNIIIPQQ